MIKLYNKDNRDQNVYNEILGGKTIQVIYADCVYEDTNIVWASDYYDLLDWGGIFYIQTDWHTVGEYITYMEYYKYSGSIFLNELIYVNEWGGTSKKWFSRKHDNILMYAREKNYKFYPERIQIPKVTAGTALDKKGTGMKTPCDVFYDHPSFSTISKERIKLNGKCIPWQKPLWLMERLLLPVTDEGDTILDPFMGTGTAGVWCKKNKRNYIGIERDEKIFKIAEERINGT